MCLLKMQIRVHLNIYRREEDASKKLLEIILFDDI